MSKIIDKGSIRILVVPYLMSLFENDKKKKQVLLEQVKKQMQKYTREEIEMISTVLATSVAEAFWKGSDDLEFFSINTASGYDYLNVVQKQKNEITLLYDQLAVADKFCDDKERTIVDLLDQVASLKLANEKLSTPVDGEAAKLPNPLEPFGGM